MAGSSVDREIKLNHGYEGHTANDKLK